MTENESDAVGRRDRARVGASATGHWQYVGTLPNCLFRLDAVAGLPGAVAEIPNFKSLSLPVR